MPNNIVYSGIKLAWSRSHKDSKYLCNIGDALSPIITTSIFNLPVIHSDFDCDEPSFVAIGSIGHEIKKKSAIFWGTGIQKELRNLSFLNKYEYLLLRGPISKFNTTILNDKEISYGDPAILLSRLLPNFFSKSSNKYKDLLVIPHIYNCKINIKYSGNTIFLNSLKRQGIEIMTTWSIPNFDEIHMKIENINTAKIILTNSFHAHLMGVLFEAKVFLLIFSNVKNIEIRNVNLLEDNTLDWRIRDFYIGQNYKILPALYVNPMHQINDTDKIYKILEDWDFLFHKFDEQSILDNFINRFKDEFNINHIYNPNNFENGLLNRITY